MNRFSLYRILVFLLTINLLYFSPVRPVHAQDCFNGEGPVTIWVPWSDSQVSMLASILAPVAENCVIIESIPFNDYQSKLQTAVAGGNPPDIALMTDLATMADYALSGALQPLGNLGLNSGDYVDNNYLGEWTVMDDGDSYALPVSLHVVSSLVWFNPKKISIPSISSYDELTNLLKDYGPLSISADGWSGFNLVQDLLALSYDPSSIYSVVGANEGEVDPNLFTQAFDQYHSLIYDYGPGSDVGNIDLTQAVLAPFDDNLQPSMTIAGGYAADIIRSNYPDYQYGQDFSAVPLPVPIQVIGEFFGAFNNTLGVQTVLGYLASPDGGERWAESGLSLSAVMVNPSSYNDPVLADLAEFIAKQGLMMNLQSLAGGEASAAMQATTTDVAMNTTSSQDASAQAVAVFGAAGPGTGHWICDAYNSVSKRCMHWRWVPNRS